MGAATSGAELVVVSDDNPRGEDAAAIRAAVAEGAQDGPGAIVTIADRAAAVAHAVREARSGDVVLVLGRGHESHQEVAGARVPLDDRDLVRTALEARPAEDVP
jgi:UDP-N-acetylmuramoyl-L-alanyl-D-glutamate--2,6-diaminopimelate ligase